MSMKKSIIAIIVDPRCKINYASYYLYGLYQIFSKKIIKFKKLEYQISTRQELHAGFGMLVRYNDGTSVKIFIDTNDPNTIYENFYNWCDVYGKINLSESDQNKPKVYAIGPSFGVKLWGPIKTIFLSFLNYTKVIYTKDPYKVSFITYIKDYIYTFVRRSNFKEYTAERIENPNYVFAMNTLWYDNVSMQTTNKYRGEFINICKNVFEKYDVGLFYIPGAENEFPPYQQYKKEFKDILIDKRIGMKDYLKGTRLSSIVFNTPSVCQCHGWKLAEYLAMGKAIISTPLSNVMPGDFKNGEHYICCNDVDSMEQMIRALHDDETMRNELKCNAKKYFEEYLSPHAVINRILDRAYSCRKS